MCVCVCGGGGGGAEEGLEHNQLSREESESETLYCPSKSLHGNLSYGAHDR